MATYQYRCDQDGLVEADRPIGTAPPQLACPACGLDARRVFSAPLLALADQRAMSLVDRTKRSADAPEVVTSLPPRRRARQAPSSAANPALRRLPRP